MILYTNPSSKTKTNPISFPCVIEGKKDMFLDNHAQFTKGKENAHIFNKSVAKKIRKEFKKKRIKVTIQELSPEEFEKLTNKNMEEK